MIGIVLNIVMWVAFLLQLGHCSQAVVPDGRGLPLRVKLTNGLIERAFKIKPLFNLASANARKTMIERGLTIGVDWRTNVDYLQSYIDRLETNLEVIKKPSIVYPEYYQKSFHAYDLGNLCWKAAMEVDCAALTVHAGIYTSGKDELSRDGDFMLRDKFHKNMLSIFSSIKFVPKRVLDIGCSTGLSTMKCLESFPEAEIIGADFSPYMLSVAKFQQETVPEMDKAKKSITYIHAAGENIPFGSGDIDLVTISLVSHELPFSAAKAIFEEAYRILPLGGAFALMDMDPKSIFFQKFASNPFAFTAFKSTEPWIQEYISMDLEKTLSTCGFVNIKVISNSPRHRTVVAFKV